MLNRISSAHLKGDFYGGLTATVIALPMALSFGIASGLGASAGLWGAVFVGLTAALFGGTPTLISEPTGPMTVMFTAVIANLTAAADNQETAIAMAFTVVMMAGVFQVLLGFFKLGHYVTIMPYMVISGFLSGTGIIMILLQLPGCLGQPIPEGGVIGILQSLPSLFSHTHSRDAILSLMTLLLLYGTPRNVKQILPAQLLALVAGTIVSSIIFTDGQVRCIGNIPGGFPEIVRPHFELSHLRLMLVSSGILGVLGSIDALLTSVVADRLTRTEHDSNKELIGQGLGNMVSGLFGGLPGAGATMGTLLNINAGGRTALSGVIRSLLLMVVILGCRGLAAKVPLAVLATIGLKLGFDIADWNLLKRAHRLSLKGALIMHSVVLITIFVDIMAAVGIGVFVANILTIERMSATQSETIRTVSIADSEIELTELEKSLLDEAQGRVLIFQLAGHLVFGVAKTINREHNAIKNCDAVIFDVREASHIGITSSLAIENAILEALENNRQVYIVGAKDFTLNRFKTLGVLDCVPPSHVGDNLANAIAAAVARIKKTA
uniref:Low affinity sulfate transporter n=1 Tax=Paulinella longichromatophora TaxID=1708747 RepID=A0A2H4ZND1_9EUKA|nr:low affinity sulfate transporter [Paulinella longichromatophora]